MSMTSTTITTKWQVTIPGDIRKELSSLQIGQRIRWEVVDGVLTGKPVRSISELAGCLKSEDMQVLNREEEKAATQKAKLEHFSKKYGKA